MHIWMSLPNAGTITIIFSQAPFPESWPCSHSLHTCMRRTRPCMPISTSITISPHLTVDKMDFAFVLVQLIMLTSFDAVRYQGVKRFFQNHSCLEPLLCSLSVLFGLLTVWADINWRRPWTDTRTFVAASTVNNQMVARPVLDPLNLNWAVDKLLSHSVQECSWQPYYRHHPQWASSPYSPH